MKFEATRARYDAAVGVLNEVLRTPLPEERTARQVAIARRERQPSRVQKLGKVLAIRANRYAASTDFIGTFIDQLELVLQRLPLTSQWSRFPGELRKLRIRQLGSSTGSLPNQELETLEIRLKEMVELARATTKTTLGSNIDRLRKECGWTFDQLAAETQLAKTLILGHVNAGKGAHPSTLRVYAGVFSVKLNRSITVADLEKPLPE